MEISNNFDVVDIISILITIIFSSIGSACSIYVILTNTKKYELTESYRCEVLSWYEKVIKIIMHLKYFYCSNRSSSLEKEKLLCELSALIEVGRIYFPNIDKHDNFGYQKPPTYRGYRDFALDCLVIIYKLGQKRNLSKYEHHIELFERCFTSRVFEVINPYKRRKQIKKFSSVTFPKDLIIEDIVNEKSYRELQEIIYKFYV